MAEHRLDKTNVGAVVEHVRSAGVPEEVAGAGLGDAGGFEMPLDEIAELAGIEGQPVVIEEQRLLGRLLAAR